MSTRAAVLVGTVALLASAGTSALLFASDFVESPWQTVLLGIPTALAFVSAGLVAHTRRPANRTGLLMVVAGFTWLLGALSAANNAYVFTAGLLVDVAAFGVIAHLVLAYPSGRLRGRAERWLASAAYAVTTVGVVLLVVFNTPEQLGCEGDCPENLLHVETAVGGPYRTVWELAGGALALALVVLLVRRWRSASPPLRRVLAPSYLTIGSLMLFLTLDSVAGASSKKLEDVFDWPALLSLLAVPFSFLFGLLRSQLAHRGVGRLLLELPEAPDPDAMLAAMRRALRDSTLEVGFWVRERAGYVDARGRPFESLPDGGGRVTTRIDYDDRPVAVLVHDAAVLEEPELLASVVAAARLGLEHHRLEAELRARLDELELERDFVRTVVNSSPTFFCVVDPEGKIVRFNSTLERTTRVSDGEPTRGTPFWQVFVVPEAAEAARRRFAGGRPALDLELPMQSASGEHLSVAWSTTPIHDEQGRQRYLLCGLDVTELRKQAELLSEVGDATPSYLCAVDGEGRIRRDALNLSLREMAGYVVDEVRGQLFWDVFAIPGEAERVREAIESFVAGGEPGEQETNWLTKDGRTLVVAWTCTKLPKLTTQDYLITGTDITDRKRQEEELRASRARIVAAADEERRRLERNLHDGAQQRLVALSLALRLAQSKLRTDPLAVGTMLEAAAEELALALAELRELARGIHPAILTDRGLAPALEVLAARVPVPVEVEAPANRLPGPVEAALYYVVSEALTNVTKYAQATQARVTVRRDDGRAFVEVADDGVGGADPTGGSGLRGLADRVAALDGRLYVETAPGAGTRIRAEIPVR